MYLHTRTTIPPGDAGVAVTLRHMRKWARTPDPLLADVAARIMQDTGGDPEALYQAVRGYLHAYTRYEDDPWGAEVLKTPRAMLRRIALNGVAFGDCDDMATLAAALGVALGIPARFVVLAFSRGGPLEHVLTQLRLPSGWREIDPARPPGWRPPHGFVRIRFVPV